MGNVQNILKREKNNYGQIHLYKVDRYWFAFERSAFYLFSVYYTDAIFKVKDMKKSDNMLIAVLKKDVDYERIPQFRILEQSENEMLIDCRTICGGFQCWKDGLVSLVTEKSHKKQGTPFYNTSYLRLEELLSPTNKLINELEFAEPINY